MIGQGVGGVAVSIFEIFVLLSKYFIFFLPSFVFSYPNAQIVHIWLVKVVTH